MTNGNRCNVATRGERTVVKREGKHVGRGWSVAGERKLVRQVGDERKGVAGVSR